MTKGPAALNGGENSAAGTEPAAHQGRSAMRGTGAGGREKAAASTKPAAGGCPRDGDDQREEHHAGVDDRGGDAVGVGVAGRAARRVCGKGADRPGRREVCRPKELKRGPAPKPTTALRPLAGTGAHTIPAELPGVVGRERGPWGYDPRAELESSGPPGADASEKPVLVGRRAERAPNLHASSCVCPLVDDEFQFATDALHGRAAGRARAPHALSARPADPLGRC